MAGLGRARRGPLGIAIQCPIWALCFQCYNLQNLVAQWAKDIRLLLLKCPFIVTLV